MSAHNLQAKLEAGNFKSTGQIVNAVGSGYLIGWGTTVGNSVQGWSKGALFVDTDASSGAQFWINEGTSSTASWKAITSLEAANTWAGLQTFTAGATMTGTLTFTNATITNAGAITTNTTGGANMPANAAQKFGFWGATPVIQPATTTQVVGELGLGSNDVPASTYVLNTSNFNGGTGTKTYTVNAIVQALKQAGILAAS